MYSSLLVFIQCGLVFRQFMTERSLSIFKRFKKYYPSTQVDQVFGPKNLCAKFCWNQSKRFVAITVTHTHKQAFIFVISKYEGIAQFTPHPSTVLTIILCYRSFLYFKKTKNNNEMLFAEGSVCGEPGQFDKHGGRCQGVPQPHSLRLGCLRPLHEDCRLLHEEYVSVISHSLHSYYTSLVHMFSGPSQDLVFLSPNGGWWGGHTGGRSRHGLRSGHDERAMRSLKFEEFNA